MPYGDWWCGAFGDFRGENWNIYLSKPLKAPPCAKPRVVTRITRQNRPTGLTRARSREKKQTKNKQKRHARPRFREISSAPGDDPADPIWTKFGTIVRPLDPIISANFQLVLLRTERVRSLWKYRIMANPALHRSAPLTRLSPTGLPVINLFFSTPNSSILKEC